MDPLLGVQRGSRSAGPMHRAGTPLLQQTVAGQRHAVVGALPEKPGRILVPVDFAGPANLAIREAARLALVSTEIVLLHVIEPRFFGRDHWDTDESVDRAIVRDCALHLRELRDAELERPLTCRTLVRQGEAAVEILAAIDSLSPDVTILAVAEPPDLNSGTPAICRTALTVLRQSERPVLLLRCN